MAGTLVARGQATIQIQKDGYTLTQSPGEYVYPADSAGKILSAVSLVSTIRVTLGDTNFTGFTIGTVTRPAGFSSITVDNSRKTVTYVVAAGTTTLADHGSVDIPVVVSGATYHLTFVWSKARSGTPGTAGADANLLDWVKEWNTGKTLINGSTVITPKIFAGSKNSDGTLTGTAIGKFALSTKTSAGSITTETVNGIYGFNKGYKTFYVDNSGNACLGYGNQYIKYNAVTGRVEFGPEVSLNWTSAIEQAKNSAISTAATDATMKADAARELASAMAFGKMLYRDPIFYNGNNSVKVYNNASNGTVTITRQQDTTAPNDSKYILLIKNTGTSSPGCGGFCFNTTVSYRKIFIARFIARIPNGRSVSFHSNKIGTGGTQKWLSPTAGTGDWKEYVFKVTGGTEDFSTTFFFSLTGDTGTVENPVTWALAYATVFDVTSAEKYTTTIDANGMYTGTLTAGQVNAVNIDAGSIKTGTIAADRIDTEALKSTLITAANINALTLTTTKGTIGGFFVDSESIYRGTRNNTSGAYASASGSITIGSNGIRGYKWRLDATGAGAIAGGNISWDATGNVTFAPSVRLQWTKSIDDITTALGGTSYPKLTKINATGIYTGTLSASQITAGTISADRIAAGSINATKLDAASIRSSIINTDYINGLSCTFTKGKIGGWTIGTSALTGTHITLDSGNRRVVVYGANSGVTSGQRVQIYYNSDTDFGLYATDSTGTCVARLGSSNRIAGWTVGTAAITKGNVSLGGDGSLTNGTKWKLNNDGSGQIASGNILWNAAGTVTFSAAVALNWKNDIEAAQTRNFGYPYYYKLIMKGDQANYYPVIFKGGEQHFKRDILIRRAYSEQAPDTWNTATHKGGLILLIKANFGGWGGADYSWDLYELSETYCRMFAGAVHCGNNCMFAVFLRGGGETGAVYHIYSDQPIENSHMSPPPIPAAPQIAYNGDRIFQSGNYTANAPEPRTLTAAVEEEIRRHRFIVLAQSNDSTLAAHPLTYISSTGIYTGTLTAAQVNAVNISASSIQSGTLSADRIAAGSISSTKLDAASIKSDIINTAYINGLSCTFTKGKIGGFTIGSDNMSVGSIGATGATPLQIRSASAGGGYWYTGAYKPLGICLTWHQNANAGHIVFGQVAASGNTPKTGFIGIQMMSWDHLEYFCLSASYTRSGRKEIYNRIAGWAFDHNHIWKNNISLGADGSLTNSTKWKLNNDGSGQIAGGNISWNSAGAVTFAPSVSAQWTNGINTAQELASAMAFGKMIYRDPTFYNGNNGINVYNNSSNGTVTITREQDPTAPNDSKYVLLIKNTGSSSPYCGGFHFATMTAYRKVFIARIIARIPAGRDISFHTNSMGTGGAQKWLTPTAGTGDWKEYICKVNCGTSGFSSTYFFALTGNVGSSGSPVTWSVAYATVFDVTSAEKYTTTIDADGIYTGTVKAGQVVVDSALVVGGSTYNGSISVRDAGNNVKVTLDRTGITAIAGKIGGWILAASTLSASAPSSGHRIVLTASGHIYHDNPSTGVDYWALKADGSATFGAGKISFANDGSGYLAGQNIKWDSAGNVTMTGTINATGGTIGGFTIGQGRIGSTALGSGYGGGLAIYEDLFRVGNTVSYALLGANTFPMSTGGTAATGRIVNNTSNSYLNNYGLYIDVKNGHRNYGIWSNASMVAPACVGNKIKNIYFTGSGYSIDFSQYNIFFVYASGTYNVNLPGSSSVASMFGYSYLPSDFACVFTLIYNYNWGGHINIMNVHHQNGGTMNYGMEKGDSLTLLCANYPTFHYQMLNYSS